MRPYVIVLLLAISLQNAFSQLAEEQIKELPNPKTTRKSWIHQDLNVLKHREQEIDSIITDLEKNTSAEIAVVVLGSIGDNDHADFANRLFNYWGIGKKDKNNGILILHILDQRKIRIETGYGMEGILPDAICKRIIEQVTIPYFKRNNFPDGHYWMVRAIATIVSGNQIHDLATFPTSELDGNYVSVEEESNELRLQVMQKYKDPSDEQFNLFMTWVGIGLLLLLIIFRLVKIFTGRSSKDPYRLYKYWEKRSLNIAWICAYILAIGAICLFYFMDDYIYGIFGFVAAFLGRQIPLLFMDNKKQLAYFRSVARTCNQCEEKMRKLSETQEDAYLTKFMQAEEKVNIIDYDVWLCKCGHARVDNYQQRKGEKCPACARKTYTMINSYVLNEATEYSSGTRKEVYTCGYCDFKKEQLVTIPSISSSSSSSSSGGSSGFGGGSSGGGGASGSY